MSDEINHEIEYPFERSNCTNLFFLWILRIDFEATQHAASSAAA